MGAIAGSARSARAYCQNDTDCGSTYTYECQQYQPYCDYGTFECNTYVAGAADDGTACSGGSCSLGLCCPGGTRSCDGSTCVSTSLCCSASDCPVANGTGACSGLGGTCSLASCNSGYKVCGGVCIPSATCCSSADCTAPVNGSASCSGVGGSCSVTCSTNYKACGAACIPNSQCCIDADCPSEPASNRHGVCGGGACYFACDGGYKPCNGVCVANGSCCSNADCSAPPNGCYKTQGTCGGGVCSYAYNDGAACNADNDKCTPNDKCLSGTCVADTANLVKCVQRECHSAPACNKTTGDCDDVAFVDGTGCGGNGCTAAGTCGGGACSSPTKDCSSLDGVCKVGLCDPGLPAPNNCATVNKPNGMACAVADKCIVSPACNGGECVGERKTCTPSSPCHVAECNPSTGDCEETVAPAGTACELDTDSACSQNAVCDGNGVCGGSTSLPDGTPCDKACGEISAICVTGECICIDRTGTPEAQPSDGPGPMTDHGGGDSGCGMARGIPNLSAFVLVLFVALYRRARRRSF